MCKDNLKIKQTLAGAKTGGKKLSLIKRLFLAASTAASILLLGTIPALGDSINPRGVYKLEHYRNGQLLNSYVIPNSVVNEGKNKLWDVMFGGVTQLTDWKIGLMDNTSYSSNPATDTMASHGGWIEFTGYSQSTRVSWGPDAAATQAISNTTPATFDITSTGTLKGIFVTSNGTKSGTSGTLWSTALFASTIPVTSGDQIKITYTVSA